VRDGPTERPAVEAFRIEGYRGEVPAGSPIDDPAAAARRVIDPANAEQTVHWGRNYLYSLSLTGGAGSIPAVVKLFRNQGWRHRLVRRAKGSKAERGWAMARAMRARGIRTPEPLMLVESLEPEGPSLLVTRRVEGAVEARFLLRALADGTLSRRFDWVDPPALVGAVARTARHLHDAGFWHRDFSIGNLLVGRLADEVAGGRSPAAAGLTIDLVDLNRARQLRRVSVSRRTRDLSRLGFHDPALDRLFVDRYWEGREAALGLKRALYRLYRSLYLGRVEGKKRLRAALGSLAGKLVPRRPYAHIPPPPEDAGMRDKAVWDPLSDQPHQHASRSERLRIRLGDAGAHARALGAAAAALPAARRRYLELRRDLWSVERPWPGVGVGIATGAGCARLSNAQTVAALADLRVDQALLRFHPWDEDWSEGVGLAAALAASGVDLVFALPQVRELVRDRARWRSAVASLGERLLPFGNRFQIGQAINRSKWGLWNYREYVELANGAAEQLRALGPVEILGPGVIDFEPHALASALNYPGLEPVDVVSSLLYVDRRGAPENEQLGFDALGKAALLRAIGETARGGAGRHWVTEFNWPLWEGPHSPAGRAVSVDEERQASYLVRYCVPLLASGLAERAYWWQLAARGYGLVEPLSDRSAAASSPRRRAAFAALATLQRQLAGARALGPLALREGLRAYRFVVPARGELVVAWSLAGELVATLPGPVVEEVGRDGERLDGERRDGGPERVRLGPAPRYFLLGAG
jgi:hypothetical protein